jgi:uncharacterized SAM-dependent methyltransferase
MSSIARVAIFPSQFPEKVRSALHESLRARKLNHKFLYDSLKQTQKWLALHEAYSPSRTDPDCERTYGRSFQAAAKRIRAARVHVVGLGCGGGRKDTRLLRSLHRLNKKVFYTPCDVSVALVLTAQKSALTVVSQSDCFPVVCDLAAMQDLSQLLPGAGKRRSPKNSSGSPGASAPADAPRLLTFFGMLPNFEPAQIIPRLASLMRPQDLLLLSANLAPGDDYAAGMERILPQYDNDLTRDWLLCFLTDLGVNQADGELQFRIEDGHRRDGLKRIAAYFQFTLPSSLLLDSQTFKFRRGESFRLFFSYRHTPGSIHALLSSHGLEFRDQWLTRSKEEGVFLVSRR